MAGLEPQGDWYINKNNNSNPAPTSIEKLNSSWQLADPSPWISAGEFKDYWESRNLSEATIYADKILENDGRIAASYGIKEGDAISYITIKGIIKKATHTAIVTKVEKVSIDNIEYLDYTPSNNSDNQYFTYEILKRHYGSYFDALFMYYQEEGINIYDT